MGIGASAARQKRSSDTSVGATAAAVATTDTGRAGATDSKFNTTYAMHEDDDLRNNEAPICTEKVGQFASAAFRLGYSEEAVSLFLADEEGRNLFFDFMKTRLSGKRKKEVNKLLLAIIGINTENHSEEKFLAAIRPLLEMTLFEAFLKSRYFAEWLRRNQEIIRTARPDGVDGEGGGYTSCGDESDDNESISVQSTASHHSSADSLALSALALVGRQKSSIFISNGKSWLTSMLAAVEFIPLAFSISLADEEQGFPLMYVNPAFEKLTGHKKKDCVGKSCSFLQIDPKTGKKVYTASDDTVQELSRAIMTGCPYSVRLRNFKANGEQFMNRLQLQPLYDQRMEYRFVIGLQLEVDDSLEDKSDVVYENQKLMSLLPKFFYDEGSKDKDAEFFAEMFG